jgi:LysM repeat protein
MNQRISAPARVLATIALVCGFLVVVAVIATSLGDDGSDGRKGSAPAGQVGGGSGGKGAVPKAYVVQNGDTLTSIAHKNGVSVARIQRLNPGVDPQILISGEKLKLR